MRYRPLVLFVVVALLSLNLFKRERETDALGNPIIRTWGTFVLFLLGVIFWLVTLVRNLADPFHQRYPENTYVEAACGILTLVAALLSYYFRITLTVDNIELRGPFFKKSYPLSSVIDVPSYKRGWLAIGLRGGGRILLHAPYSGVPYFLKSLSARIERRQEDPQHAGASQRSFKP
jgi:hypothetical protein